MSSITFPRCEASVRHWLFGLVRCRGSPMRPLLQLASGRSANTVCCRCTPITAAASGSRRPGPRRGSAVADVTDRRVPLRPPVTTSWTERHRAPLLQAIRRYRPDASSGSVCCSVSVQVPGLGVLFCVGTAGPGLGALFCVGTGHLAPAPASVHYCSVCWLWSRPDPDPTTSTGGLRCGGCRSASPVLHSRPYIGDVELADHSDPAVGRTVGVLRAVPPTDSVRLSQLVQRRPDRSRIAAVVNCAQLCRTGRP